MTVHPEWATGPSTPGKWGGYDYEIVPGADPWPAIVQALHNGWTAKAHEHRNRIYINMRPPKHPGRSTP